MSTTSGSSRHSSRAELRVEVELLVEVLRRSESPSTSRRQS